MHVQGWDFSIFNRELILSWLTLSAPQQSTDLSTVFQLIFLWGCPRRGNPNVNWSWKIIESRNPVYWLNWQSFMGRSSPSRRWLHSQLKNWYPRFNTLPTLIWISCPWTFSLLVLLLNSWITYSYTIPEYRDYHRKGMWAPKKPLPLGRIPITILKSRDYHRKPSCSRTFFKERKPYKYSPTRYSQISL